MGRLIGARIAITVPLLFGVSVVTFVLLRIIPGDPANAILGQYATPELVAEVRRGLGLDQPIVVQYWNWLTGLLQGNFGFDYVTRQPIAEILTERLPVTLEIGLLAFVMGACVGVPGGVWAAVRQNGVVDGIVRMFTVAGVAVPPFWLGILLILTFALGLRLLPASGYVPFSESPVQNVLSVLLPAAAMAAGRGAFLAAITRSSMAEILQEDHIKLAQGRGIPQWRVIWKHGLRNSGIPIVAVAGLQVSHLVGAAVIVEEVFGLPGLGRLLVQSMLDRNYGVVQATILVIAILTIVVNLIADLLYIVLNPKLRESSASG